MQRTIYHGSSQIVRIPRFNTGTASNDYGSGFYCTENSDIASEWAVSSRSDGFVNRYTIETNGLRILNLNSPEYCILHWLSVLLSHREFDACDSSVYQAREYIRANFSVDTRSCDCVIGFRADDCNYLFAQSFLDGDISYRQFNDAVRLNDTGRQFVIKSKRAFDRMLFNGYTVARSSDYCPAVAARDRQAMQRFFGSLSAPDSRDMYISQIVSRQIQPYDTQLKW